MCLNYLNVEINKEEVCSLLFLGARLWLFWLRFRFWFRFRFFFHSWFWLRLRLWLLRRSCGWSGENIFGEIEIWRKHLESNIGQQVLLKTHFFRSGFGGTTAVTFFFALKPFFWGSLLISSHLTIGATFFSSFFFSSFWGRIKC